MKRITSLLMASLLLLGMALPASAASESADARLKRETAAVKETLQLDTEQYTDFHGDVSEQELGTVWSLSWSGEGGSVSVDALEDGTVTGYWNNSDTPENYYNDRLPVYPKYDPAAAKAAAEEFLGMVLDPKTEKAEVEKLGSDYSLNGTNCYFSGTIRLNGLASPLPWNLTVRGSDNKVIHFYREAPATAVLDGVPSKNAKVRQSDAAQKLKETLRLEPVYVTDGDNPGRAVLRYVPKEEKTVYVDAQTGELLTPERDMVAYAKASGAASEEAAMDVGSANTAAKLTDAELAGAGKLEGVLDSAALDRAIRAESAYQLEDFTLSSSNYRLTKDAHEKEEVLCTLYYTRSGENREAGRTFTVDARTGAVRSLSGYTYIEKETPSDVTAEDAQKTAEEFLSRYTEYADQMELYESAEPDEYGSSYSFTFARRVNGYFCPEMACTLRVDRVGGAISGLSFRYDETAVFDSTTGLVPADDALNAWFGTYEVTLAYRYLSRELNPAQPQEARMIANGMTRFMILALTYGLERDTACAGIDGKTCKPVFSGEQETALSYSDLKGHWAEGEIETLARYGVGYDGGKFLPEDQLSQWELVCLLASTQGMRLDVENASAQERDVAYRVVRRWGALNGTERNETAPVTRGELVRVLLDSAGYGPAARLQGIYQVRFSDAGSIPAEELGYAALAQGLNMVSGSYQSEKYATRAMAAAMLHRLMQRDII